MRSKQRRSYYVNCEHIDDIIRAGSKRGENKKKHNLEDIVKMLIQCDRAMLPKFVALDLARLSPISIYCIDVSALMRKQQLQDVEISNLKTLSPILDFYRTI